MRHPLKIEKSSPGVEVRWGRSKSTHKFEITVHSFGKTRDKKIKRFLEYDQNNDPVWKNRVEFQVEGFFFAPTSTGAKIHVMKNTEAAHLAPNNDLKKLKQGESFSISQTVIFSQGSDNT